MKYKKVTMQIQFEMQDHIDQSDLIFDDDQVIDGFCITRNTTEDLSLHFRMRNPIILSIDEEPC